MAIKFDDIYPVEAKNTSWQKKKSFLDKAKKATKTGLGAELLKAEAAWNKFKPYMDKLDVRSAVIGGRTPEKVQQAKTDATKILNGPVKVTAAALLKAAAMAKKTSLNKGLSKPAVAAAKVIETKLMQRARFLRDIKLDDFDQMINTLQQQQQGAANLLKPYITSIRQDANDVKRNPTVNQYVGKATTGFYQGIRGLNAAIVKSQMVELMKWGKTNWTPLAQAGFNPKNDGEVVGKVNQVLTKLTEFERLLG